MLISLAAPTLTMPIAFLKSVQPTVQPYTFLVWQHACLPAVQGADTCVQLRLQLDMLGVSA